MDWGVKIKELSKEFNDNSSVEIYWKLTQAHRNNHDIQNAELIASKGLKLFPDNPVLISEWAWNSQIKKDFLQASVRIERLIEVLNSNVSEKIYTRLLGTYKNLYQFDKMEVLAQKAIIKYPNSENIKVFLNIKQEYSLPNEIEIIVLTTFPKHASNNVGDQLITHSFLKLLENRMPHLKYHIEFRANNLDKYLSNNIKYILAPGFSVSNEVYPNLYALYTNLDNLPNFFPIGCSFQHISPSHEVFESNKYSENDNSFFYKIKEKMDYPFLCRDGLITDMLAKNGIEALYSGDMAIYDEDYLNDEFNPPENINSIVFTIGHHEKYENQAYCLLILIKHKFSNPKLYVSYHSKVNSRSKKIGNFAISLGYEEIFMFGDVNNLEFYNDIDLHIGYRLHGHISFLRRRKPSILLVEDARSYGFANTKGTHIGCFNALNSDQSIDNTVPLEVIKFVENQIENQFKVYNEMFSFIDKTFNDVLLPILNNLVLELKQ